MLNAESQSDNEVGKNLTGKMFAVDEQLVASFPEWFLHGQASLSNRSQGLSPDSILGSILQMHEDGARRSTDNLVPSTSNSGEASASTGAKSGSWRPHGGSPRRPRRLRCLVLSYCFIQQIFAEHLLHLRHWSGHLRYTREENIVNSLPLWSWHSTKGTEVVTDTEEVRIEC